MRNWIHNNRGVLVFVLCLGSFRTAIADWNPIPTGSMRPTILEGDVVLVNRLAYDMKLPLTDVSLVSTWEPQRGDIVTFSSPKDGMRLIKRIVGIPGDTVEMRNEVFYLNGVAATYESSDVSVNTVDAFARIPAVRIVERIDGDARVVQSLPGRRAMRAFGPVRVPAGEYFMLGDNRDDSEDSRYIGSVPRAKIIGRAHHLLASADIKGHWALRFERFGARLQ